MDAVYVYLTLFESSSLLDSTQHLVASVRPAVALFEVP